jgi:hypothetical protein
MIGDSGEKERERQRILIFDRQREGLVEGAGSISLIEAILIFLSNR